MTVRAVEPVLFVRLVYKKCFFWVFKMPPGGFFTLRAGTFKILTTALSTVDLAIEIERQLEKQNSNGPTVQ